MIITQALKDVMELEKKIKRGEAILAYWRQWLIDYRKQHPKPRVNQTYDKPQAVKPETMTPEELVSIRKGLELSQKDMAFRLGITRQHLSDIENSKYLISKAINQKINLLQAQGDSGHCNSAIPDTPTRIKSLSTKADNGGLALSEAQREKITFCRNCGAPFRISEPVKKEVKPLIPREGTIPGPCPVCLKSPLVVSQEQGLIVGRQVGAICPYQCSAGCGYQLGHDHLKCGLGLIPVVEVGLARLEDVA